MLLSFSSSAVLRRVDDFSKCRAGIAFDHKCFMKIRDFSYHVYQIVKGWLSLCQPSVNRRVARSVVVTEFTATLITTNNNSSSNKSPRNFMISAPHQILYGSSNEEE